MKKERKINRFSHLIRESTVFEFIIFYLVYSFLLLSFLLLSLLIPLLPSCVGSWSNCIQYGTDFVILLIPYYFKIFLAAMIVYGGYYLTSSLYLYVRHRHYRR